MHQSVTGQGKELYLITAQRARGASWGHYLTYKFQGNLAVCCCYVLFWTKEGGQNEITTVCYGLLEPAAGEDTSVCPLGLCIGNDLAIPIPYQFSY